MQANVDTPQEEDKDVDYPPNHLLVSTRVVRTAEWVFETREECSEWVQAYQDRLNVTEASSALKNSIAGSSVQAARSKQTTESRYGATWSEPSALGLDFLQTLEDVFLGEPPDDIRRPVFSSRSAVQTTAISKIREFYIHNTISKIVESFKTSADLIDGFVERPEEQSSESAEEYARTVLRGLLREQLHYPSQESNNKELERLYSVLLHASGLFRSASKRERNSAIIETFLNDSSLEAYDIYQCMRGLTRISTTPINDIESVLATTGLLVSTGGLALSHANIRTDEPQRKAYLETAAKFCLLDLAYGTNRWKSWYYLGQCYDCLSQVSSATKAMGVRAVRCYSLAIAASQQVDYSNAMTPFIALIYHDLGVLISFSTYIVDFGWGHNTVNTWRMAITLFRRSIELYKRRPISFFMLAFSTYRLLEASKDCHETTPLTVDLRSIFTSYQQALSLVSTVPGSIPDRGWGSHYDFRKETVSLFQWLEQNATDWPVDVRLIANQSMAMYLEYPDKFVPEIRCVDYQPRANLFNTVSSSRLYSYTPSRSTNLWTPPSEAQLRSIASATVAPLVPGPTQPPALSSPANHIVQDTRRSKRAKTKSTKRKERTETVDARARLSNTSSRDEGLPISQHEIEDLIRLGISYEKQLNIAQSIRCFNALTVPPKGHTDRVAWWFKVAPLLEKAGKPDLAMRMYKMVLERNSENAEALQHLGRLYHEENESHENQDRAIGYLERAVAFDKTNPRTWYQLGRSYVTRGFLFKAHEAFHHAIHRDREYLDCWLSLGSLNVRMKLYDEAQQAYDAALGLDQKKVDCWIQMGSLMRQVGKFSKAIDSFRAAKDLDPTNPIARQHLMELIGSNERQDMIEK